MFVAIRELRRALGRFALITLVVVLVTVLVTFLGGLTAGLRHQNVSALNALPGSQIVFAANGTDPSYDRSALDPASISGWQASGAEVTEVGISRNQATTHQHSDPFQVALFGISGAARNPAPGTVFVSSPAAAELGVSPGQTVSLGNREFRVATTVGDLWYAHTPVVYLALSDWQQLSPNSGAATVLAVNPAPGTDVGALAKATRTTSMSTSDSLAALPSYNAENTSLTLMTLMLLAISALVIGAFFLVWAIQRIPDTAVLKALGAPTAKLAVDALGQAGIVLVGGSLIGISVTIGAGGLLGSIPFVLSTSTVLWPATAIVLLGLARAALSLRYIISTDPLTALRITP